MRKYVYLSSVSIFIFSCAPAIVSIIVFYIQCEMILYCNVENLHCLFKSWMNQKASSTTTTLPSSCVFVCRCLWRPLLCLWEWILITSWMQGKLLPPSRSLTSCASRWPCFRSWSLAWFRYCTESIMICSYLYTSILLLPFNKLCLQL